MTGGGNAGLVGPEATRFLKGLFESRGDGLRSELTVQLAGAKEVGSGGKMLDLADKACRKEQFHVPGGAIVAISPDDKFITVQK